MDSLTGIVKMFTLHVYTLTLFLLWKS